MTKSKRVRRKSLSSALIRQLLEKQNSRCNYCKIELKKNNFHLDHIKPLSKGGSDIIDNMQLLCIECHNKKNKKEGFGFRVKQPEVEIICKECGKIMYGFNEKHVNYMLDQHILAKHRDKLNLKQKEEKT